MFQWTYVGLIEPVLLVQVRKAEDSKSPNGVGSGRPLQWRTAVTWPGSNLFPFQKKRHLVLYSTCPAQSHGGVGSVARASARGRVRPQSGARGLQVARGVQAAADPWPRTTKAFKQARHRARAWSSAWQLDAGVYALRKKEPLSPHAPASHTNSLYTAFSSPAQVLVAHGVRVVGIDLLPVEPVNGATLLRGDFTKPDV